MKFAKSNAMQRLAHDLIPGGCHTYAKGVDQYPVEAPGFIARGQGSHVWDVDGNEFIEYGAGLRAVTLGHAFAPVVRAAAAEMERGVNFSRPASIELECAAELVRLIPCAEMVKFAKNGSDATTAAVKLSRAATGRELVALCADQPFFSVDDWFIGTTAMSAGIPEAHRALTVRFRYNDLASVEAMFAEHAGRIACLVLEAATAIEPAPGFLQGVEQLCRRNGTVFVLDEIITGFRWHNRGAQSVYGISPDLATFGKGLANGFSLAALVGRRELMERGGLRHDQPRCFLLSTTNGAETHALAAALATMRFYQEHDVVGRMYEQGQKLREGLNQHVAECGLEDYFEILGRSCNLVYAARDADRKPSQAFRSLFLQEMIGGGVLCPSFVVNYSHSDEDIEKTIAAAGDALRTYAAAIEGGVEHFLNGRPVQPVNRPYNGHVFEEEAKTNVVRPEHVEPAVAINQPINLPR